MNEVDTFLADVVPRLRKEVGALHAGDAAPRKALWSHRDPVSLFGAELSGRGWAELERVFDRLAASFTGSRSSDYDVVSAGVSGDLGYLAAIERSVRTGRDGAEMSYALRVTTILRREDGVWRVVHRHGDPFDDAAGAVLTSRRNAEEL